MNNLVIMKDQQAVTSSLQVAETFGKKHKNVTQAIEAKLHSAENSAQLKNMFSVGNYVDGSGKANKLYYMNRDGFSFIAFGFTGREADNFKLQYIEAFNKMEKQVQLDTANLSPELQMFKGLFDSMAKQELATTAIDHKLDNISEIVRTSTMDWRKGTTKLIQRIAIYQGGGDAFKDVRNGIYNEVDNRAGVSLKIRLTNKRRRMADEGVSKSSRDRLNKVDVIAEDKKLIEIYMALVKEFAIKNNVWEKDY